MTEKELLGLESLNELLLAEEERESMLQIFAFMQGEEDAFSSVDTENVEPMVHVIPIFNVFREDKRAQVFSRENLLKGAPEHTDDSWQVPRLVK